MDIKDLSALDREALVELFVDRGPPALYTFLEYDWSICTWKARLDKLRFWSSLIGQFLI